MWNCTHVSCRHEFGMVTADTMRYLHVQMHTAVCMQLFKVLMGLVHPTSSHLHPNVLDLIRRLALQLIDLHDVVQRLRRWHASSEVRCGERGERRCCSCSAGQLRQRLQRGRPPRNAHQSRQHGG